MVLDSLTLKGNLKIQVFGEDGSLKDERNANNLIVKTGKNFLASRAINATSGVMSHMAVGSGTVAPTTSDTALGTEITRVTLTSSTTSANVITYTASYPAGVATGKITEAGILNAATAGTLLSRTVFSEVNKGANDSITITWNITIQ